MTTPSSEPTVKREYVVLRKATDWPPWFDQTRRYAVGKRVWQYIDPEKTDTLVLAPMPTTKQFLDECYQDLLEQHEQAVKAANEAGTEPPPQPARPKVTADDERFLRLQLDEWGRQERVYARTQAEYIKVVEFVNSTVDGSRLRLTEASEDLRHTIVQLRGRVSLTKRLQG